MKSRSLTSPVRPVAASTCPPAQSRKLENHDLRSEAPDFSVPKEFRQRNPRSLKISLFTGGGQVSGGAQAYDFLECFRMELIHLFAGDPWAFTAGSISPSRVMMAGSKPRRGRVSFDACRRERSSHHRSLPGAKLRAGARHVLP